MAQKSGRTKLSEAEVEELREAFAAFDKDGSGTITSSELGAMLKGLLPSTHSNLTERDLARIVARFDINGDGVIDFNEFLSMMCATERKTVDELASAFRVFDKDGDGTITANEIYSVMRALGENVDLETCALMIRSVDLDGNGTIDVDEFRKMMRDGFAVQVDEGKQN